MAIHLNTESMLHESLPEMLSVAKYCIEFRKNSSAWPDSGCYGYPAALILLSVADSIGSYVERGNVKNHFNILNNAEYYNLGLDDISLKVVHDYYRNPLAHNSALAPNIKLAIGKSNEKVIEKIDSKYHLKLVPLYKLSLVAVNKLLSDPKIFEKNRTIQDIEKKN